VVDNILDIIIIDWKWRLGGLEEATDGLVMNGNRGKVG
jgi:hypothetical protein